MDKDTLVTKLDELHELRCAEEALRLDLEDKRKVILAPVAALLEELELEYRDKFRSVGDQKSALEGVVKDTVKNLGETVRGSFLMAVFAKGRTSWATAKLDGYAKAHPEIAEFKTVGEPSVSIRNIE